MPPYTLITGASSSLGQALAEALARQGRSMILMARYREELEPIALELTERFGVEVLFRACDLTEPLRLSGFLLELEEHQTRIDLLVNCATLRSQGHFLALDWGREQDLIELNILAMTRLCHAVGNTMAVQGGGQILNVAGLESFSPGPWRSSYSASKAYVLHFTEGLREELRQTGIRVQALCPGPIRPYLFNKRSGKALSVEEIARLAVIALDRRRTLIIPGWRNRFRLRLCRTLPRWLARKLAARANRAHLSL